MSDLPSPTANRTADYSGALWLLKLGALANLYFIVNTPVTGDLWVVVPAQMLFVVSAYRCLLPVRYEGNIVFHDSPLSSVFATRLLATFSEVAYIFLFAYVLQRLNQGQLAWITPLAWIMVVQVVVSQCLVWTAVLTGRLRCYFWEEFGWAVIFVANTAASLGLYFGAEPAIAGGKLLLQLNLLFGVLYLPWQTLHLRFLRGNALQQGPLTSVAVGLRRSLRFKDRRSDADSWGGWIGLSWMTAYWATLIPLWVYVIAKTLHAR